MMEWFQAADTNLHGMEMTMLVVSITTELMQAIIIKLNKCY